MNRPSLHPRDIRARIWRHVLSASDREIHDGLNFYPEANWLCCMLSSAFSVPVVQVAGIYAALSPLNTWDSNEANIIAILRWHREGRHGFLPKVNTTQANQVKAVRIASGEDPLSVLKGSKVRAFYQAIADPNNTNPIAVDRHLFTVACGVSHSPTRRKSSLSRMSSDRDLYTKVESAYHYTGEREGLGNRIASIVWFVQRRVIQGQMIALQPSAIVCCNRPMHRKSKERRWSCGVCNKSRSFSTLEPRPQLDGFNLGWLNGRRTVHLGFGHPYANSGGWQYVNRYVVMKELGRKIERDEHAHHVDNNKLNDAPDGSNYQLLLAESHGRHHRYLADLAGYRDELGRFTEHAEPISLVGL